MFNTLLIIAGTAPAIVIAILAHNRAAAAESRATKAETAAQRAAKAAAKPVHHIVEVRHSSADKKPPELPPFLQGQASQTAFFRRIHHDN